MALPVVDLPLTVVGVILLFAIIVGIIMKSLRQNQILGYILAGMILGPLGLSYLKPNEGLSAAFGEIGLFVLLFYLGLELSFKKFVEAGPMAMFLAVSDMLALAAAGGLLVLLFGFSPLLALIVSIMLFCTSTAIVSKFAFDSNLTKTAGGGLALIILILQDFLGIMLLVFVTSLSASGNALSLSVTALVFAVAVFSIISQFSRKVEAFLTKMGYGHVQTSLYALGIGLLVATLASFLNLSTTLGAYFAGFALAETQAGNRIKKDLNFLRDFFLIFFFVSFGTTIFVDPTFGVVRFPPVSSLLVLGELVVGLLGVILVAHFAVFGFLGKRVGLTNEDASLAAILMTPIGEFVVIIAAAATAVLSPVEAALISPLAFLLILVTVTLFQPLYDNRHHHQRAMNMFPENPILKKKKKLALAHTDATLAAWKRVGINAFTVLCIFGLILYVYDRIPGGLLPLPYSREVTAFALFAVCTAYPAAVIIRSLRSIYQHLKGIGERGQLSLPKFKLK